MFDPTKMTRASKAGPAAVRPAVVANDASLRKTLNDALASLDSKATWDGMTAAAKLETARQVLRSLARLGLARLDQP